MAERNDQGFAVGDIDPRTSKPIVAIVTSNKSRQERALDNQERQAEAHQDLNERQFQFQQEQAAADQTYKQHEQAARQAGQYLEIAKGLTAMQEEARSQVDAADFLTAIRDKHVTDEDYDAFESGLLSKLPRAPENKAVQAVLERNRRTRGSHLEAKKQYDLFTKEAEDTGKVPGEAMTRKAMESGLVKKEDFANPELQTQEGLPDHRKLALVAAERQGNQEGLRAEQLRESQNMSVVTSALRMGDTINDPENADFKLVYQAAVRELADKRRGGPKTPGSGQAKPEGAPAPKTASDWTP